MFNPTIESGRIAASFYKSWIMAKRNFFTIFEVIFWPFIGLMSIGLMATFFSLNQNTISFILIGAIAFSIVQVCQIDIAYVMLFDMWSKSIKHTFIAPVRGHHLIIGSLLFGILRSSLVFIILMVISFYAFGFNFLRMEMQTRIPIEAEVRKSPAKKTSTGIAPAIRKSNPNA